MQMNLTLTPRQAAFVSATADEVLFGGAAGGGKSFGQLADALRYAIRYPGSKQLILRRTYSELDKSLIRAALALYPRRIFRYNATGHMGKFANGSVIDFGYCAAEGDVFQYQSAEYDVIRFDELTHFTEFQYVYLLSRLRGVNGYPKQAKSSTNPGGVGHGWVKARFIDPAPPNRPFSAPGGTRVFLPARLQDNPYLEAADPQYRNRLLSLPDRERRALLEGDWDLFEGQFFPEFRREVHTVDPFPIPPEWRRYRTIDYGLDRLACLWVAVSGEGDYVVYREVCASDLIISEAAAAILEKGAGERIYRTLAPPDLWSRSQETGKSKALLFAAAGLTLTRTGNDRETGWLALKELLRKRKDGTPRLRIFRTCTELCRCLPMLQTDPDNPSDVCIHPHAITHAPDALRGFAITFAAPEKTEERGTPAFPTPDLWEDYHRASPAQRAYLRKKYNGKKGTAAF